ncbi:hypothetical protein JZO77_17125 [Enterococcus hulanensis]|uniref:hypothetical protein n=1 Tax=Enterococcus hulanensis TaxID=2559929 RepID=UPI001A8E24C4|nr:hypothetical protein [Enterococcus hulanensis]MBO0458458.1 hypothetical protein [Enterococcus hulanensis]MDT2662026.1 hypothetical protein [Enterococcus hulanensis]
MSKKVLWIWSFNNRQQTVGSPNGMVATMRPIKFQNGMREALAPEWEIEFISDDLSEELPDADVIVIPKTNKALYAERSKNAKVVWVSGNEVVENDFEGIKKKITET